MPSNPNKLSQFWQELKRRKVVRVITVYAAAAFVILELTDIVAPSLGLPDWCLNFIIILLIVGFIIAVILSWVYDIHPEEGIVKTEPAQKVKEEDIPKSSNSWKIASYISFVVIVALVVFHILSTNNRSKEIAILDKSIAVLPFISLSDDPEKQYLADGVMDAILLHLSKIEDLRVMSRTSVEQYRKTEKTVNEICQELDVAFLLEGSFQKYGDQAKLTVQLIIPGREEHIWANDYDRHWKDIFSVQSEVAQKIAGELQVVLTPEVKQLIKKVPTINMTAWDLHLQAKDSYYKYLLTKKTSLLGTIVQKAYTSLSHDPEFALAYYWLGVSSLSDRHISTYYKPFYTDSALSFFNKALELDSTLAKAYSERGMYYFEKYQLQKAINDLGKAIRFDPNDSEAYLKLGIISEDSRDFVNALRNYKKAEKLERADMVLGHIYIRFCILYICIGDFQSAEIFWHKTLQFIPEISGFWVWPLTIQGKYEELLNTTENIVALQPEMAGIGYFWKSVAQLGLGRTAEAEESIRIAMNLGEIAMNDYHRIGIILWVNGKKDEAMEYFNKEIRCCKESLKQKNIFGRTHATYDLAGVFAFLGNREEAIKWLREYEKIGFSFGNHEFIKVDPMFDSLRNDEEFKEIVKRANDEIAEIRNRIKMMEKQGLL